MIYRAGTWREPISPAPHYTVRRDGRPSVLMLVQDDTPTPKPAPEPQPEPMKVTARMLKIRELIEQGEYPDRDELAERIVDATVPPADKVT